MPSCILVIDDSKLFRKQIINALQDAALFDVYREAKDGLDGYKSLSENVTDLVICDLEMPRMDGLKFLQLATARPELQDIPIILLTGNQDRDAKLKGLEQGASDYLTKPFDAAELVARVKIHLKMKKLQDELKAANDHFKQLSNTDPLTNLYNRRFLTETLESELQRAKRLQSCVSLLIIDIDHFKDINDVYGHQVGDKVLVAVAETLQKGGRTYDIVSRYGGEEFILLFPGTQLSGAVIAAERLREAVQSLKFPIPMDRITVTISIGVATFPSDQVDGFDSLFRLADEALYLAKKNGRNRVAAAGGNPSEVPLI
jgi:two-component system cell cycle response regulator